MSSRRPISSWSSKPPLLSRVLELDQPDVRVANRRADAIVIRPWRLRAGFQGRLGGFGERTGVEPGAGGGGQHAGNRGGSQYGGDRFQHDVSLSFFGSCSPSN